MIKKILTLPAKFLFQTLFPLWQSLGFHLTKKHYYSPIPDTRTLKPLLWDKKTELQGIEMHEQDQLLLLQKVTERFANEYQQLPQEKSHTTSPHEYYVHNGSFESVDGEMLYSMIRFFTPQTIIEIGSGFSTRLIARALQKNAEGRSSHPKFISIEPYPDPIIKKGISGSHLLIEKQVQDVPVDFFKQLCANDILFIDSSHVLKIGSDVQYEILEILPRLQKGVIIHIHDIFLPAEYKKEWVLKKYRFWNEQYLLQAFLSGNTSFKVLWGGSFIHLKYPEKLQHAFPSYQKEIHWPGSFWIQKVK